MNQKYLRFPAVSIAKALDSMPDEFYTNFWDSFEQNIKDFAKDSFEAFLDCEADEVIGAKKYARSSERKGYKNGYRPRKILRTSLFGDIRNFKVPRVVGVMYKSKVLVPYQQRTTKFDYGILNFYVNGQTTRRLRDSFGNTFGSDFSHNTVSVILQKLKEKLDAWRCRKLTGEYVALVIDGVWIHLKTERNRLQKSLKDSTKGVILAVMGIKADGTKELLGFRFAASEATQYWEGLLLDLTERGLNLTKDALIIHDGAQGIKSAVDLMFPYHQQQLCVFHFIAGSAKYSKSKANGKQIKKDMSMVYKLSKNTKTASEYMREVCKKWLHTEPRVVRYISRNFNSTLTYLKYPKEQHAMLKTTNYLERSFRQIGRKLKDVCVFPNFYSAERIFFLEVLELNAKETGEKPFYAR